MFTVPLQSEVIIFLLTCKVLIIFLALGAGSAELGALQQQQAAPPGPCLQLWRTQLSSHLIGSVLRTGRFGDLDEVCERAGFWSGDVRAQHPTAWLFPSLHSLLWLSKLPTELPQTQPRGLAHPMSSTLHPPVLLCWKLPGIHIQSPFELPMLHSCSTL